MVDMVELWESGCYGAVSVERLVFWWYGQPLALIVSEGKVYEGYIEHRTQFNVLLIRWYY